MSQSHLTHKYRPQRFSEVAGQDMIKSILSRAAQTGTVAPAYLFSGTRGVGKTTIARIFAKAINCEKGPAAEPCNECGHCRQIQAGAAVDVAEIDGASHTGVDNVRSLKEDVGFAPIDCRYKVFIIDEAHMLSKGAFNALLKTLEEPPPHATFIMATTEPHKFPPTIISRCQHYTFQRLTQKELEDHLKDVLGREGLDHDADAVSLLARRGAGSVRDAMSLMGQVLALGGERLTAEDVRKVLGLAGREIMFRLLGAVHGQDCVAVAQILREVLDQGLDLGFFLRELTECWRNLFLISQAGERAMDVLDAPDEEIAQWKDWAARFPLAQVHACWQLTLEGQQRVKSSVEPALALELLLLNLAYLPRLLPLTDIAATGQAPAAPAGAPAAPAAPAGPAQAPPAPGGRGAAAPAPAQAAPRPAPAAPPRDMDGPPPEEEPPLEDEPPFEDDGPAGSPAAGPVGHGAPGDHASAPPARQAPPAPAPESDVELPPVPQGRRDWPGFLAYATQVREATGKGINGLEHADASVGADEVVVHCKSDMHAGQIRRGEYFTRLQTLVRRYFGDGFGVRLSVDKAARRMNPKEARQNAANHPLVNTLVEEMDARIMDVRSHNTN